MSDTNIQEVVKQKYGEAAKQVTAGGTACCGGGGELSGCDPITKNLYDEAQKAGLPAAAVAASLVFPPAVLVVPVIETIQLGENYDLIIGVDGNRVTNFMDFQDQLREAQPGETVYLNILRGGERLQLPVEMPQQPNAAKLEP